MYSMSLTYIFYGISEEFHSDIVLPNDMSLSKFSGFHKCPSYVLCAAVS